MYLEHIAFQQPNMTTTCVCKAVRQTVANSATDMRGTTVRLWSKQTDCPNPCGDVTLQLCDSVAAHHGVICRAEHNLDEENFNSRPPVFAQV